MNPVNIVNCLVELVQTNLNVTSTHVTQNEREVAHFLFDTISSFANCKRYQYEEETTLDLANDSDPYTDSDEERVYNDSHSSEANDEWEDKKNAAEHHHLTEYSEEFMRDVVDYADAKNKNGKRRRTWKTVYHRFKTLPSQTYVSRFRKYLKYKGTKRQKTQNVPSSTIK